jgi:branched-chain amino acid transport system substrate-binding protein
MITPSATGDAVTTKADYVFRACYADSFQGKMAAQYAAEQGYKEVGVLYASGDAYSKGLRDAFVATCKTLGITVKTEQKSETIDNETDFSSQFAAIKKSGIGFLYAPYYYSGIGPTIVPQARSAGYNGIIMGSDGYDGVLDYIKTGNVSIYDNVYYTNHYSAESKEAVVVNFVKAYKAAYKNEEPNAFAALAYDCVYMLKQSLDNCGGKYDAETIKTHIEGMTFSGVTGNFTLDNTGTPQKSVVIMKLVSDKAAKKVTTKYVETIDKK